jgi:hypothetical protein
MVFPEVARSFFPSLSTARTVLLEYQEWYTGWMNKIADHKTHLEECIEKRAEMTSEYLILTKTAYLTV